MLRVISIVYHAGRQTTLSSLGTKTYFHHYRTGPCYLGLSYYFFFVVYSREEARDKRAAGNNTGPSMGEEMG